MPAPAGLYHQLLRRSRELGYADGRLAAELQCPDDPAALADCHRGRDPEQYARWLWAGRPGTPPAGLTTNAGLWYLDGFRAALREACSVDVHVRPPRDGT